MPRSLDMISDTFLSHPINKIQTEIVDARFGDLTVWEWPDRGAMPRMHWAHATGFNARAYTQLLNPLSHHFSVSAWDMRGHGKSRHAADLSEFQGWQTYYRDLLHMLDSIQEPILLAGHSIGATVSLYAAAKRPDKVCGLVLCDPVILDTKSSWFLAVSKFLGQSSKSSYAQSASRRRSIFSTREEAFSLYRSKSVFRSWKDEWLLDYIEHGFIDREDGQVELACEPVWEATTFSTTEHNIWKWLGKPVCPIRILAAEHGSTFPKPAHAKLMRRVPQAGIKLVKGSSHFLPMEKPELVINECLKLCIG